MRIRVLTADGHLDQAGIAAIEHELRPKGVTNDGSNIALVADARIPPGRWWLLIDGEGAVAVDSRVVS